MIIGEDYTAFISYSHEDRPFVERLYRDLQSDGTSKVWLDIARIEPGDSVASAVTAAIHSSGVFLLVASAESLASKWVQYELEQALHRRITDNIPVVVLKISDVKLPEFLAAYLYIDFASNYATGLRSLKKFLKSDTRGSSSRPSVKRRPCTETLTKSSNGQLRRAMSTGLSRDEMSIVWFDVLGSRMDDECRHLPPANCAMELILRSEARFAKETLIRALCEEHGYIAQAIE